MLRGKKLLLADDSAAIRKVIELTFADEGMDVTAVSDGRLAWEKLEQVAPDIVLADVFMPEVDGYELCRSIKQSERFVQTPVVLLVSSFEPFDEAEARRAGADDVVTKPFQSIRQLVSRVGSLLGGESDDQNEAVHDYSTLGLRSTESATPAVADQNALTDNNVTVLVEAPMMDHHESPEAAEVTCATDIELQTADTQKLERIEDEPVAETAEDELHFQDTIEIEPINEATRVDEAPPQIATEDQAVSFDDTNMNLPMTQAPQPVGAKFDDALLDLDDDEFIAQRAVADEVVLDLDFEETTTVGISEEALAKPAPSSADAFTATAPPMKAAEPDQSIPAAEVQEWSIVTEPAAVQVTAAKEEKSEPIDQHTGGENLSADAIDAIARRMVEQMSDKVVREIAWEVVPELAELLIKKKLEEQK